MNYVMKESMNNTLTKSISFSFMKGETVTSKTTTSIHQPTPEEYYLHLPSDAADNNDIK